jgi:UDP-GlcNAc:undecaprenyl-phosphate/decaprenyl-phosphate GlcNAc-1-phosphate transferase
MKFSILFITLVFGLSIIIVYLTLPKVVGAAKYLSIFSSTPEENLNRPANYPVGGIAVFFSFILTILLSSYGYDISALKGLNAASLVFFFVGLKNDVSKTSWYKVFILLSLAVFILIFTGKYRITEFYGLFGLYRIDSVSSTVITYAFIMATVFGWKRIDYVDGLASGMGILSAFFFGTWFFLTYQAPFAIVSFVLAGTLVSFFFFNFLRKSYEVRLGDSGSFLTGSVIAVLAIRFMESCAAKTIFGVFHSAPVVTFAVLFIPLFDLFVVVMINLSNGKLSIARDNFSAHWIMKNYTPLHIRTIIVVLLINLVIIALVTYLDRLQVNIHIVLAVQLFCGVLFMTLLHRVLMTLLKRKYPDRVIVP